MLLYVPNTSYNIHEHLNMLLKAESKRKNQNRAKICCSQRYWSVPFFLGSVWHFHYLTFDLLAWLCPAAGLTLAVQPAVSPEGNLSLREEKNKFHSAGMSACCSAVPNLLTMGWLIWMTLLGAPFLSVRCFPPSSVPRWRTGQGRSTAGEDQEHRRMWPWNHSSLVVSQSHLLILRWHLTR